MKRIPCEQGKVERQIISVQKKKGAAIMPQYVGCGNTNPQEELSYPR